MRDRNYALGMVLVFLYGVLTLAPMVLITAFLKDLQDYPMATIGLLLSPRIGLFMAMILWAGSANGSAPADRGGSGAAGGVQLVDVVEPGGDRGGVLDRADAGSAPARSSGRSAC